MQNPNFIKKLFLYAMIVSLSVSGLLGIFIFLFGNFGDIESNLLLTTFSIGCSSLTGLCCSTIYPIKKYKIFSVIGILITGLCFIFTLLGIWVYFENDDNWNLLFSLMVLAITFAHISLLLNIKIVNKLVKNVLISTVVFICIVAFMLLILIIKEFNNNGEFFYRLLGVFAILDIVGTIITPILNKTQNSMN